MEKCCGSYRHHNLQQICIEVQNAGFGELRNFRILINSDITSKPFVGIFIPIFDGCPKFSSKFPKFSFVSFHAPAKWNKFHKLAFPNEFGNELKGGILFAIAEQARIPVRYIGVGEGIDDLQEFNANEFVNALLAAEVA